MKAVAFIFARGGSKGLPGKNILQFGGKHLIGWSIEQALSLNYFDRVIVSTDSIEIAEVARSYGAEVPFLRPIELAQDNSPEWLSWQHALKYLSKEPSGLPDVMVSIPATAPLRSALDIENCLKKYREGNIDVVITIAETQHSPYFNMVTPHEDGALGLLIERDSIIFRRQDAPLSYNIATVCYVANVNFVMTHNGIFEGRVKGVIVPPERAIDIDTPLDFKIAQCLFHIVRNNS